MTPRDSALLLAQTARDPWGRALGLVLYHVLGSLYDYGAAGPRRFDCSGLVLRVVPSLYVLGGLDSEPAPLPRSAADQWSACWPAIVAPFPGALGGWGAGGVCGHVALCLTSAGHVLSASGGRSTTHGDDPRAFVRVEPPGYWSSSFLGFRALRSTNGGAVGARTW